ncbi:MAG: GNAT family N-acetyltransferase [Acidimicrobiia bacterium]
MDIELRPIGTEEFEDFVAVMGAAFSWDPRPEDLEHSRAITEFDRTLAAFEGDRIVGTAGAFSYELTVPGGSLPAAGVTAVSVFPTHRRRGILSSMMRHQLDDVRERGEPLAILWASESIIYGRYGYGIAADGLAFELERTYARLANPVEVPGRVRLVERDEALKTWPEVYDRARRERPGAVNRTEAWWDHETLYDPEHHRDGYTVNRLAVYEEGGRALGYVRYRIKDDWPGGLPGSELAVGELISTTPQSYVGLWQYVLGVDLIRKIEARRRPPDEPLRWMLADPRRLQRRPSDALWARLVDVPTALTGRRYSVRGSLIIEVRDAFCPWNEGTYLLEGGPEGASCRTTRAAPEIVLSAAELGAAYLGGTPLSVLRAAGRVQGEEEAVRRADLMFSWSPAPWSPEVF